MYISSVYQICSTSSYVQHNIYSQSNRKQGKQTITKWKLYNTRTRRQPTQTELGSKLASTPYHYHQGSSLPQEEMLVRTKRKYHTAWGYNTLQFINAHTQYGYREKTIKIWTIWFLFYEIWPTGFKICDQKIGKNVVFFGK